MKSIMQVWAEDKTITVHFDDAADVVIEVSSVNALTSANILDIVAFVKMNISEDYLDYSDKAYSVKYEFFESGSGGLTSVREIEDTELALFKLSIFDLVNQ